MPACTVLRLPTPAWRPVVGALVLCVGQWVPQQVRGQHVDFAALCMRVEAVGLVLETSEACVNAFRNQPEARAQFIQAIQKTMAQAAAHEAPTSPDDAPRSLKRLHERASSEAGRWAGGGAPYYGAHP